MQQLLLLTSAMPKAVKDDARKLLRMYVMLHEVSMHEDGETALELSLGRWERLSHAGQSGRPLRSSRLEQILQDMLYLSHRYALPNDLFRDSLDSFLERSRHEPITTSDDAMRYMYGVVEVPAVIVLYILQEPIKPTLYARLYARALCWKAVAHTIPQQAKTGQWLIPQEWCDDIDPSQLNDLHKLMKREMERSIDWFEQSIPLGDYIPQQLASTLNELFIRTHSTTT